MAERFRWLDQLVVKAPCPASWEAMNGDSRERFCAQCAKPVHDFSQWSAGEIVDLVERSEGSFCARLTRDEQGRLVTLPDLPPPGEHVRAPRRPSPLAAAAVSVLLGVPPATAASPVQPPPKVLPAQPTPGQPVLEPRPDSVTLRGQVLDKELHPVAGVEIIASNLLSGAEVRVTSDPAGRFRFKDLPLGLYQVSGFKEGALVEHVEDLLLAPGESREVTLSAQPHERSGLAGDVRLVIPPWVQLYGASELVALGVAGESRPLNPADPKSRWVIEVVNPRVLKGSAGGRPIRVLLEPHVRSGLLPPGALILAFLEPAADVPGRERLWQILAEAYRLEPIPPGEFAVVRDRLVVLSQLEPDASAYPERLAAWLAGTVAEPASRRQGLEALLGAFERLAAMASARGLTLEQMGKDLRDLHLRFVGEGGAPSSRVPAPLLAAQLSAADQARLTAALRDTEILTWQGYQLSQLVAFWHPQAARAWRAARVRDSDPENDQLVLALVRDLAAAAGDASLLALVSQAEGALKALRWDGNYQAARHRINQELLAAARAREADRP